MEMPYLPYLPFITSKWRAVVGSRHSSCPSAGILQVVFGPVDHA